MAALTGLERIMLRKLEKPSQVANTSRLKPQGNSLMQQRGHYRSERASAEGSALGHPNELDKSKETRFEGVARIGGLPLAGDRRFRMIVPLRGAQC